MKHLTIIAALIVLIGAGCSTGATYETFEPTQGASTTPEGHGEGEGPFKRQIATAISYDGFEYLPTDDGWITDQANVPDAVQTDDGTIYLYYSGWIVGGETNKTAVAISENDGKSWDLTHINVEGAEGLAPIADPDIVLLEDGTFRLYFTSGDELGPGIFYAESEDGINFTGLSATVKPDGEMIIDSTTFRIGDQWHMYALGESVHEIWHFISDNGQSWEITEVTSFPINGTPYMPSNGFWIDDTYHLFMFNSEQGDIRSQYTKDGYNWVVNEDVAIGPLDDGRPMMDSTIIPLDNSYLMIYVTTIAE